MNTFVECLKLRCIYIFALNCTFHLFKLIYGMYLFYFKCCIKAGHTEVTQKGPCLLYSCGPAWFTYLLMSCSWNCLHVVSFLKIAEVFGCDGNLKLCCESINYYNITKSLGLFSTLCGNLNEQQGGFISAPLALLKGPDLHYFLLKLQNVLISFSIYTE